MSKSWIVADPLVYVDEKDMPQLATKAGTRAGMQRGPSCPQGGYYASLVKY